jgi:hypothetical protein
MLLQPYDQTVLYGSQKVEGLPIVSPPQLYLDLSQNEGSG